MSSDNLAVKLWNSVQSWVNQNAVHYLYVAIPMNATDETYDPAPLVADASYLRLWLSEMFVTKKRTWFVDWYPAVHTSVQLMFGSRTVSLTHVAQAPNEILAQGVLLNFPVTELVPFRGGVVTVQAALLGLQGENYLQAAVGTLESFSGLLTAPLGQVLEVATKISSAMQDLLNATNGQVHLALQQAFTSAGAGGNPLRPGYFAVVLATDTQIDPNQLTVKQGRLRYQGTPFTGFDYMLFRIEARKERDDWRLANIEMPLQKAIAALLTGNSKDAEAFKTTALIAALEADDLAVHDRRRVALAIKQELSELASLGEGATSAEERSLGDIVATRAMPIEVAISQGKLAMEELFGD